MDIERRQQIIAAKEAKKQKLYAECKSLLGWPLVGVRPSSASDEDAEAILDKWETMLDIEIMNLERNKKRIEGSYSHYRDEVAVPAEEVQVGRSPEEQIKRRRNIQL